MCLDWPMGEVRLSRGTYAGSGLGGSGPDQCVISISAEIRSGSRRFGRLAVQRTSRMFLLHSPSAGETVSPRVRERRPLQAGCRDRQALRSGQRLHRTAQTLGGGENARPAEPLPSLEQGLGEPQSQGAGFSDDGSLSASWSGGYVVPRNVPGACCGAQSAPWSLPLPPCQCRERSQYGKSIAAGCWDASPCSGRDGSGISRSKTISSGRAPKTDPKRQLGLVRRAFPNGSTDRRA
jgi:hypothetical protein